MIGTSTAEHIWVVSWAAILHSIAPVSLLYCILALYYPRCRWYPLYLAFPEAVFFVYTYIYQRYHLQRPAVHPDTSKEERALLFDRCLDSTQDHDEYLSRWFLNAPVATIKRDNVKEFLLWAFMSTDLADHTYDNEVESYVQKLENRMNAKIPSGRAQIRCMRLTLDKVNALHRSLSWYFVRTTP